jgi:hypothetical protein
VDQRDPEEVPRDAGSEPAPARIREPRRSASVIGTIASA